MVYSFIVREHARDRPIGLVRFRAAAHIDWETRLFHEVDRLCDPFGCEYARVDYQPFAGEGSLYVVRHDAMNWRRFTHTTDHYYR